MTETLMTVQTTELFYLALCAMLTGVIWIPYILNRIWELGLWTALKNPNPDEPPKAQWAFRMMNAHRNAIENLVVFAPLTLVVVYLNLTSDYTALLAQLFFISRLAHVLIYTFGVPVLRTLVFALSFFCQLLMFLVIV